jgi:type I restriction enzyme S subunit
MSESTKYPLVPLSEVLVQDKEYITELEPRLYPKLSVKLYGKGVVLDEPTDGATVRMKRHQLAKSGQVILSEIWAKRGAIGIVPDEGKGALVTSHFFLFDIDESRLLRSYMRWLLTANYFEPVLGEKARGTTGYAAVRPEHFLACKIPLPPLGEQRRIVARIEELAALIEEAHGLRVKAREEAEALLTSALREVLCGLDQDHSCEKTELGSIAELQRGRFSHRPRNDPRFFGGSHPWIQIGEIESSGKYITDHTETLNDEGLAISRKFPKGTLLISIAATIGAIGILGFDCCVPDSIVAVMPDETKATSEFLYYFLAYIRSHLEEIAPQSAQKNINLRILRPLPISVPPLDEQRRIVAYLDGLQAQVDELTALQDATQAELDALLPSVLDRAFKGEL